MITFGSGQTNGAPLALTTTPTTLHTAPAGAATPHRVTARILGAPANVAVHLGVYASDGVTLLSKLDMAALSNDFTFDQIPLNGGLVLKVWADQAAGFFLGTVDDQANVAGVASVPLMSGLIAAVVSASRYGINVQGGAGTATIANAQVAMPRAGTLSNLRAFVDATVSNAATLTISVFKNGVATALSVTIAAAQTTVTQVSLGSIPVAADDLITFGVVCGTGAPVANVHASCLFQ